MTLHRMAIGPLAAVLAIAFVGCGSDDVASGADAPVTANTPTVADTPIPADTPVVPDTPAVTDTPAVAASPVADETQIAAATELFERMQAKMATVDTYRFELHIFGPRDSVIGATRGTWVRPDKRRIDFLDRAGEPNREIIRLGAQQFFRSVGDEVWQETPGYDGGDPLEHGDISGLSVADSLPWQCEAPHENSSDRSCVIALVDIQGTLNEQPATFGQLYVFDIANEDSRLLRWIRFDAGKTFGESLSEFLEGDPDLEFKSIGRLIFEYSDHDAPVSDEIFLPEPFEP